MIEGEWSKYEKRCEKMLLNSFDYVIECIKIYKRIGLNNFNGFLASDAIVYFDYELYKKGYQRDKWCKPCTDEWYKLVEKFCKW